MVKEYSTVFRVYAANEIAYATDDPANTDPYHWETDVHEDIFGGIYDTTLLLDTASAKYFFAVDLILEGYERWMAEGGGDIWLPGYPLRVDVCRLSVRERVGVLPGVHTADNSAGSTDVAAKRPCQKIVLHLALGHISSCGGGRTQRNLRRDHAFRSVSLLRRAAGIRRLQMWIIPPPAGYAV